MVAVFRCCSRMRVCFRPSFRCAPLRCIASRRVASVAFCCLSGVAVASAVDTGGNPGGDRRISSRRARGRVHVARAFRGMAGVMTMETWA